MDTVYELNGHLVPYRINSSYCKVTFHDNPYLLVFGGYDENSENFDDKMYLLDINNKTWLPPRSTGIYRNGSSCISLDDNSDNVVIIGGLLQEDECAECLERNGNMKSQFQDGFILIYNVRSDSFNMDWNMMFKKNSLNINEESYFHNMQDANNANGVDISDWSNMIRLARQSVCFSKSEFKIYISGGVIGDLPYGIQKYMYILDLKTFKIEKREFCKKIEHEIIEISNKIWSFGGLNETMKYSFMTINTLDLDDSTINEFNLNINNKNMSLQNDKKRSINLKWNNVLTFKKYHYNQISENQIIISNLLNLQFFVLNTADFKIYPVPLKIENLNWLFIFSYGGNLMIVGNKKIDEMNDINNLDSFVSIPLTNFGKVNESSSLEQDQSILNKFQNAYENEMFSDFKIRSRDQKVINVHKLYLLMKWPFFERMIMTGMLESQTDEMVIDEPYENIKLLMDYLYTNKFPMLDIDNLLSFAHLIELYDLTDLKSLILNRIYITVLSPNKLIEFWELATILNSKFMKSHIETLIYKNWGYIVRLPTFQGLEKSKILELLSNLEINSQIVTSTAPSLPLQDQLDNSCISTDKEQIITPEIEMGSTFEVFQSPGIVDYWTPLAQNLSDNESDSYVDG